MTRRGRRRVYRLLILAVSVVAVFYFRAINHEPKVVEEEVVEPTTSINALLSNSLSDFDQTEGFDRAIASFMRRWELNGASFALMKDDSLVYAKGYGYADTTRHIKCDANHVFRIASVSKLITATAVFKLIEQGKLSLNTKVFGEKGILCDSLYLNLQNEKVNDITVEHLLRHTSGLSTPHGDPAFSNQIIARVTDKELPLTTEDIVEYASQRRLRARPGERYDYSNMGYIVLGKVIEEVTNLDYESYVKDSILAPIGCYDMHIGRNYSENLAENEVQYYEVKEAVLVEAYDGSGRMTMKSDGGNNVTLLGSAGGWVASPAELLRFVAAIDDCDVVPNILSKESINAMTDYRNDKKPMGWASTTSDHWLRSGSMAGTTALIKRQDDGYTWVFLTNNSAWIGYRLSDYMSPYISRAVAKVKNWSKRDLFEISSDTTLVDTL